MKAKLLTLGLLVFVLSIGQTNAQVRKNQRQNTKAIAQGVRSGELTKIEAVKLAKDQKEIRQDIKEAKADGTVTKVERKEIRQDQRQQSREIKRKKNNRRSRG